MIFRSFSLCRSKTQTVDDYESKLKVVGKFETCEQFWSLYSYLKRPHEFETLTEIHVFKDGELFGEPRK